MVTLCNKAAFCTCAGALFVSVHNLYTILVMNTYIQYFQIFFSLGGTWLLNCSSAEWPLDVRSGACTDGKTDRQSSQVNKQNKGRIQFLGLSSISNVMTFCPHTVDVPFFSTTLFKPAPRTRTRASAKKMSEAWAEDGWSDLLPGVLSGSVRDVDHGRLAVCVHWKREGRFVRVSLIDKETWTSTPQPSLKRQNQCG